MSDLVKRTTIFSKGDPSVGIPNQQWELTGDLDLSETDDREWFRHALANLFEDYGQFPVVVTFDDEIATSGEGQGDA